VICIPTTSGTGSEATPYGVYTDRKNRNKCGYGNEKIFPRCSIVDPVLTYSMPEKLIVDTGLDVLTHAVEAYLSTISFPLNDQLALHAVETVLSDLPEAVKKEKGSMNRMSEAAAIGGIVITHGGTILPHIMGYPLTVFHGIPHGRACAVLMPRFLEFLRRKGAVPEKLEILDEMFSVSGGLGNFLASLDVSTDLKSYGVTAEEIPEFVKKTIVKDDVHITPAEVTEQDITDIYGLK
jgi:alcohol dehydrogenase class IV